MWHLNPDLSLSSCIFSLHSWSKKKRYTKYTSSKMSVFWGEGAGITSSLSGVFFSIAYA